MTLDPLASSNQLSHSHTQEGRSSRESLSHFLILASPYAGLVWWMAGAVE